MNLFERVFKHVKSTGHQVDSAEHQLLIEFVQYLGKDPAVVDAFFQIKGLTPSDDQKKVVSNFVAEVVPLSPEKEESVEVVAEPIPVIAPVDVTIAAGPAYEEYKAAGNVEPA